MDVENDCLIRHSSSSEQYSEESEMQEENERATLEKRLSDLKKEQKDKMLLRKCINVIQANSFLNKHIAPSLRQKRHHTPADKQKSTDPFWTTQKLLAKKDELNGVVMSIVEENRVLEREIREKKMELKDLVKERDKYWTDTVVKYQLSTGKLIRKESPNCSYSKYINKIQLISRRNKRISDRILVLCQILHNLICFSGQPWALDKTLTKIVLSTGRIFQSNFGAEDEGDKRKAFDNLNHILNNIRL